MKTTTIDYFPSLSQTHIHGPIDLAFPSLDGRHWSVCHIIQMQYLRLFFSDGSNASSFTADTHSLDHGFVGCNNCNTTCHFQYIFLRTSNRLFPHFQRPPFISGQDLTKMSGFMSPHFPTVPFQTSNGSPVILVFLEISKLILFPKLEPPWLLR